MADTDARKPLADTARLETVGDGDGARAQLVDGEASLYEQTRNSNNGPMGRYMEDSARLVRLWLLWLVTLPFALWRRWRSGRLSMKLWGLHYVGSLLLVAGAFRLAKTSDDPATLWWLLGLYALASIWWIVATIIPRRHFQLRLVLVWGPTWIPLYFLIISYQAMAINDSAALGVVAVFPIVAVACVACAIATWIILERRLLARQ